MNAVNKKVFLTAGARPNFMKIAPLYKALCQVPGIDIFIVHTGQHYDVALSDSFFRDLDLPQPYFNLGVGSGSHACQTALVMRRFEELLLSDKPDAVIVVGDVNSTLACALATIKITYEDDKPRPILAHVEAGLRSGDLTMPEEINRKLTDVISDLLFTTEPAGEQNLEKEGITWSKIHFTGNVMIDTLLSQKEKARTSTILETLGLTGGVAAGRTSGDRTSGPYAVCTLHRPSNVDNRDVLEGILEVLNDVGSDLPVILPLHPRTRARLEHFGLSHLATFNSLITPSTGTTPLTCLPPLGYLDFLHLMANARLVLTDSGGIQEETTILRIPCVTIRENTERPVTIEQGTNVLAGTSRDGIRRAVKESLGKPLPQNPPDKWDGQAAGRIVNILIDHLNHGASQ